MTTIEQQEFIKYQTAYAELPEYSEQSPGLRRLDDFIEIMQPRPGARILDIGCGTGRAGLELAQRGYDVRWLDITHAGLDEAVPIERFHRHSLWSNWRHHPNYDVGYCSDVMEHIPTEYTMLTIERILANCVRTWFQIALFDDQFNILIRQTPFHQTIRPFTWWRDRFLGCSGKLVDARDIIKYGVFIVER